MVSPGRCPETRLAALTAGGRPLRLLFPFAAAALLALGAAPVHADDDRDDHVEARALLERGEILPLVRILEIVRARQPGDVIEVELDRDDGVWEYEVKVLDAQGVVRKVTLAARDGTVLKVKVDD